VGMCARFCADSVLSLGWTTGALSSVLPPCVSKSDAKDVVIHEKASHSESTSAPVSRECAYTDAHLAPMLALCNRHGLLQVTFPVRACYLQTAYQSVFSPVLAKYPTFSLTVWASPVDSVDRNWIAANLSASQTFVDLDTTHPIRGIERSALGLAPDH